MNSTLLRTDNRVINIDSGLVFEKITDSIVHVYFVDDGRGAPNNYLKYRGVAARTLWKHVCGRAVDVSLE